jgi:hypothetical protein
MSKTVLIVLYLIAAVVMFVLAQTSHGLFQLTFFGVVGWTIGHFIELTLWRFKPNYRVKNRRLFVPLCMFLGYGLGSDLWPYADSTWCVLASGSLALLVLTGPIAEMLAKAENKT